MEGELITRVTGVSIDDPRASEDAKFHMLVSVLDFEFPPQPFPSTTMKETSLKVP